MEHDQKKEQVIKRKNKLTDEWVTDFHFDIDTETKPSSTTTTPTTIPISQQQLQTTTIPEQVTEMANNVYHVVEFQTRHGRQYVYQKYNEFYYSNHSCTIL